MQNGLLASIVPFDLYASPILLSDRANIVGVFVPANSVSDLDFPGLFTSHLAAQSEPCFSLPVVFLLARFFAFSASVRDFAAGPDNWLEGAFS